MTETLARSGGVAPPAGEVAQRRRPTRSAARALQAQHVAVVVAALGLPLLRPGGPGNTGGVDLGVWLVLAAATAWASWSRHPLRFPFFRPITLLVLGGAVAGAHAAVGFDVLLTLGQDFYVLTWGIMLANLAFEPTLLRTAARAIGLTGVGWAAVLLVGVFAHLDALAGITAREGSRASLTLGDPNLAASYFLVCLMLLRASGFPQRRALRWPACAVIVLAMGFTGSNGGAVSLLVATSSGFVFGLARRRGAGPAVLAALVLGAGVAGAAAVVDVNAIAVRAQAGLPVLRDSIGRQAESGSSRANLTSEGLRLFLRDGLIGIGPNQTKTVLAKDQAPYVKEAHNDYTASFVERGVTGGAGVLLLAGALLVRARRLAVADLAPGHAAAVPRPELLAAAVLAVLVSGAFYEVLHFRHAWALFGVVAGLDLWGRR